MTITASTIALVMPTVGSGKKISKLCIDIELDATASQVAGIGFTL